MRTEYTNRGCRVGLQDSSRGEADVISVSDCPPNISARSLPVIPGLLERTVVGAMIGLLTGKALQAITSFLIGRTRCRKMHPTCRILALTRLSRSSRLRWVRDLGEVYRDQDS